MDASAATISADISKIRRLLRQARSKILTTDDAVYNPEERRREPQPQALGRTYKKTLNSAVIGNSSISSSSSFIPSSSTTTSSTNTTDVFPIHVQQQVSSFLDFFRDVFDRLGYKVGTLDGKEVVPTLSQIATWYSVQASFPLFLDEETDHEFEERCYSEIPVQCRRFAILEHLILLVINVIECPIVLENLFLICRMRGDSLHHQSLLLLNVLTSINHFKTSQDYCHLHSLYNSINAPGEWIKQLKDKLTTDQMQMTAFAEYIASLAAGGKSSLSGQLVAHCVSMLSQQTSSTLSIIYPKFNTQIDEWIMSLVQMANLHHTNFNSCVQALACVCTNMNTLVFRIRGETMACVLDLFLSSSSTSSSIRHHLIDSFNNDRSIHISVFSDLIHNIKPRLNLLQALLSSRQYSVSSLVSSIESYYEDKESSIIAKLLLHALIHHYPNVKSWCAAALTKPKNNYGGKRSEMPSVSTLKSRLEKMLAETTAAVDVLVLDDHCDHNSINGEIFSNVFEDNIDYSDFVPDDGGELWSTFSSECQAFKRDKETDSEADWEIPTTSKEKSIPKSTTGHPMKSAFKKFRQHHQHHHGLYWPPQQQLLLPSSPPQPKPSSSSSLHPNHASALAGPPPKFYGLSSEMDNEINDDEGCIVISVGAPLPSTVTTADEDDEEDGCPI